MWGPETAPAPPTRSARSGERGGPRHPDIADRAPIRNGRFGFNGVLTGIALSVFLQWHVAVYSILSAIVSTIVMPAVVEPVVRGTL